MMLKNLLNRRVTLGRLILVLLFAVGLVFAGTYDGFIVETEAERSCCEDDTEVSAYADGPSVQPKVDSCCGSELTDVSDRGPDASGDISEYNDDEECTCLGRGCGSTSCSDCETVTSCKKDCGCNTCSAHCKNQNSDSTMCGDGSGCNNGDRSGGAEG